ncbi:MAG: transcription termination/antitermination protein NusG [Acidobacteria bacterium]|nr:transcription termination/antitermination protein NusG [Acidobacteriota bacterium]
MDLETDNSLQEPAIDIPALLPAAEPEAELPPPEPEAELPPPEPEAELPPPEPEAELPPPEPEAEPAEPASELPSEPAPEGPAPEGEEAAEEAEPAIPGEWYFVHTQSGYENKVKTNLETRILSMNMEEKIFEVVIPTEEVVEVKSGKKQVVKRKLFPGYLLVRTHLDDESWYVVRNTPGVTGFVGSTARPVPLTEKEVDRILARKPVERARPRLEFQVSDIVRVTTGPFANFQGVIGEIDVDRSKLKVLVNIFGRETPVELGFDQVQKV